MFCSFLPRAVLRRKSSRQRYAKNFLFIALLILPLFSISAQENQDRRQISHPEYRIEDPTDIVVEESIAGTIQTSQQMVVIEKEDIERSGAADIIALLQEIINLNVTRNGPYGNVANVNMRGLRSERVAFLINGIPVNSAKDGGFDSYQIDLNSIERIEVVYGGSDTKYNVSGSQGGLINIITVDKQGGGLRFGASVSNTSAMPGEYQDGGTNQSPHWEDLADTQNYALWAAYGGDDFSISSNVFFNRAGNHFIYTDNSEKARKENNEVWDIGAAVSAVWDISEMTKLISSTNFYYGDKNISNNFNSPVTVDNQNDLSFRQSFLLDIPRAFHDDLSTEISLSWNFSRLDYAAIDWMGADTFSRHDQQNVTLINRWNWYLTDQLTLRSGFDYSFSYVDSTETGNNSRHDGGIYLTAEYQPAKQFLIIPSVKAVFTSAGEQNVTVIPKLGLLWNIADFFTLKNNYFRSFRIPSINDLYWPNDGYSSGNLDLKPEDGWGADIGAEWRITEQIRLESVFFAQWMRDMIAWSEVAPYFYRPENVDEVVFFGLDTNFRYEIPVNLGPVKKITPSLSYKYLLSYVLGDNTFASDIRFPYSPEHTFGFSIDILWESGSLLLSGQYEGLRYVNADNSNKLEPHFLFNATVNQNIGDNFVVFGSFHNIFNESYESVSSYPMPGFTLTLGLRFNIDVNQEAK